MSESFSNIKYWVIDYKAVIENSNSRKIWKQIDIKTHEAISRNVAIYLMVRENHTSGARYSVYKWEEALWEYIFFTFWEFVNKKCMIVYKKTLWFIRKTITNRSPRGKKKSCSFSLKFLPPIMWIYFMVTENVERNSHRHVLGLKCKYINSKIYWIYHILISGYFVC